MFSITAGQTTSSIARYSDACKRARTLAVRENAEAKVVHTETGALAYVTSPKALAGRKFGPWERIQAAKIPFEVSDIEGAVPAYVRVTAQAVVFRPLAKGGDWIVESPKGRETAVNTKAACAITNRLVAEAKSERILAREAAKEAKKVAREAARAAKVALAA